MESTAAYRSPIVSAEGLLAGVVELVVLALWNVLEWLRVELKGIEPSASRVRFKRIDQKHRGERKIRAPRYGEDDPPTDGETKSRRALWRFWSEPRAWVLKTESDPPPPRKKPPAVKAPPPAKPSRKGQVHFCSRCGGEGHTRNNKAKCPRLGGKP